MPCQERAGAADGRHLAAKIYAKLFFIFLGKEQIYAKLFFILVISSSIKKQFFKLEIIA